MTAVLYRIVGACGRGRVAAPIALSAVARRPQSPDSYLKETFKRILNSAVLPSSIVTS